MATEVGKVLDKWGETIVKTLQKKLISGGKSASGNLVRSLNYKYTYANGQYKIQISGAPYLINVDRGRRRGAKQPPIKAIEAWLKIKNIPIKYAFPIAKNIAKRGIKPFPLLNLGQMITRSPKFKQEITRAIATDLQIEIKSITKRV